MLIAIDLLRHVAKQGDETSCTSKTGGKPLMEALAARATNRALDPDKSLSQQQLSNMLWAAWGINRPDGRRTAVSSHELPGD